jgi:hypothetical protein
MSSREFELGHAHIIKGPGGVIDHLIDKLSDGHWLNQFICEQLKVIDSRNRQLLNLEESFARQLLKRLDEEFFNIYCSRRLPTIDHQGKLTKVSCYQAYKLSQQDEQLTLSQYLTLINHQKVFQRLFGRNIMQSRNREIESSGKCNLTLRQQQEKILFDYPHVISISQESNKSRFTRHDKHSIQEFRNFLSELLTTLYQSHMDYRIYGDQVNGQDIMLCFSSDTDVSVAQLFINLHEVKDTHIIHCDFYKQQEELKQMQSWKMNSNDYINQAKEKLKLVKLL